MAWEVISHMATPQHSCCAAVLPDNQLIVIGGQTGRYSDAVEFATSTFRIAFYYGCWIVINGVTIQTMLNIVNPEIRDIVQSHV